MRSRTGCLTCRQRKLKCDEESPVCLRCRKGSRRCRQGRGTAFRHQQNPSIVSGAGCDNRVHDSSPTAKITFNDKSVWMAVPSQISFVHVSDRLSKSPNASRNELTYPSSAASIEAVASDTIFASDEGRSTSLGPGPGPRSDVPLDREGALPTTRTSPATVDLPRGLYHPESDHKESFLLRHFAETVGHWMDLFDLNAYFASEVPMRSLACPLLKSAVCAYAAKQLGRVGGCKAVWGGVVSAQARMEVWPETGTVDWNYQAAKYYETAIQQLIKSLQRDAESDSVGARTPNIGGRHGSVESDVQSKTATRRASFNGPDSEEVFAATAILSVYEFLSASGFAWNRHLSGARSLFEIGQLNRVPEEQGFAFCAFTYPLNLSRGRRAIFWNFARQDYLAAFINQKHSLLDPEDTGLWRDAGLELDEDGLTRPSNEGNTMVMREDMISNTLVWLLAKIVNFLNLQGNTGSGEKDAANSGSGITPARHDIRRQWERLNLELEVWFNGLPDTFIPCARLKADQNVSANASKHVSPFDEIWYHIPMCGSTMQNYHFARMLLLDHTPEDLNMPQTTVIDRLKSYQPIAEKMRFHSYEICGISMSRLDGSVRCHSLQPLFFAGKFLTDVCERINILNLLRGIEADLGWATEYRIQELLKFWGWADG